MMRKIFERIMQLLFHPQPQPSIFDMSGKYLTVVNNFIERIFYDKMYQYIYSENRFSNLYESGDYMGFIQSFQKTEDAAKKLIERFYQETTADVVIKMSPQVRSCFYTILYYFYKSLILNFIDKITSFKFKSTEEELNTKYETMLNQIYDVELTVINESNPGLKDYVYKYIDAKIRYLSLEIGEFVAKNSLSFEEKQLIHKQSGEEIPEITNSNENAIKSAVNYHLFILRLMYIQTEKDILSDPVSVLEQPSTNNNPQ